MKERWQQWKEKALGHWQSFNRRQQVLVVGTAVLFVAALALILYFSSRPEYEVVYTNLDEADTGEITQKLKEAGIPYELSSDGSTISVPSKDAAQVRVDLAAEGLPSSGSIGYELFQENMTFGTTEETFGVLERDAMAGELERMIRRVQGVRSASVMINLPQESVWITDEEGTSTASIIVDIDPNQMLTQDQINGLYLLVSKSVPNLPIENITIVDQNSNLLTPLDIDEEKDRPNYNREVADHRAVRKQFEQDIQHEVRQLLGTIIGQDKVVVSVVANLNFDQEQRVEELVEPVNEDDQEGIAISVERIQESFSGEGASEGTVGTGETDIPTYPAAGGDGGSESERLEERINYEVNRITKEIAAQPYRVEDLTINVGVEPPDPNNIASISENGLDTAIQNILGNIVRASIHTDEELTDEEIANKISVTPHPLAGRVQSDDGSGLSPLWWTVIGVVAALALGGVVTWIVVRRRRLLAEEEFEEELTPQPVTPEVPSLHDVPENEEAVMRRQLQGLARRKPEEFANLLRTWLSEE